MTCWTCLHRLSPRMDLLPDCARMQKVGDPDLPHACWEPKPEEPEQGVLGP